MGNMGRRAGAGKMHSEGNPWSWTSAPVGDFLPGVPVAAGVAGEPVCMSSRQPRGATRAQLPAWA